MNNAEQKAFFQQCLYTALMALMREKKFEKISVGEICQRAGVSRMTYYRSYNNKEDILLQHLDECFAAFLEGLDMRDFYGSCESGHAARRIAEIIISKMEEGK